jgi:Skp family chaperone for outer membrane proteins
MKQASIALFALALGLVLAQDQRPVVAEGAKGEFPVLIVDFADVVENCEEAKDIFDAWKSQREKTETDLRTRAEQLNKAIQEIQKKTKLSERDDKLYKALKKRIEEKGQLEGEMAYKNVTDQDFIARRMQELMRGAKAIANEVRLERGAQLVIGTKRGNIQLESQQDLQEEMLRRRVLAYDNKIDITDEVKRLMNADWAKRKAQDPNAAGEKKDGDEEDGN